jgi:GAF domain-containing protein
MRLTSQRYNLNAEYRSLGVPEPETDWTPEMQMAWEQETSVVLSDFDSVATSESGDGQGVGAERSSSQTQSALAVPIRLRGEVIGVLDLQETDEPRHWSEEEVSLASTVADQVAQAIENARLLEETHRRAAQLSAAAKVARDATAILDVDQLLDETVRLISREFGYYHVGVFLIDDNKNAVLQAASSEGGRRMLERGYKLKVGGAGTVGYVAATGEPRIVEMVDTDSGFFSNPDLPDTLSEMALPLKSRGRAIGVLDVQSTDNGRPVGQRHRKCPALPRGSGRRGTPYPH